MNIIVALTLGIAALFVNLSAQSYYSQPCERGFATSGELWNAEPKGEGKSGSSKTISEGSFDLVLQPDTVMFATSRQAGLVWNASNYHLHGATLMTHGHYAEFNGGDMQVNKAGFTFTHASPAGVNAPAGGVKGSSKIILDSNTIALNTQSSKSSGIFDFGLAVIGKGTVDLEYSNPNTVWLFSALTKEFRGHIRADRFNGGLRFGPECDPSGARLSLGRKEADRHGKLDLSSSFSIGTFYIQGERVPKGTYSYEQLVALNPAYANNLTMGSGEVTVLY